MNNGFSPQNHPCCALPADASRQFLRHFARGSDEKKLLAVDDEPDALEVIKESFPSSIVMTAQDFDSGLKLINENIFDLVILDIMGVNGFELLKACRDRHLPAA